MFGKSVETWRKKCLFCKVKLSMRPLKQQNQKSTALFSIPIFQDRQLCIWSCEDSSAWKILKMYFISGKVLKRNTANLISKLFLFNTFPKTKYILRTFRVEGPSQKQKQSCISWKIGIGKCCWFFLFSLF